MLAGVLCYIGSLDAPFVFDDLAGIVENNSIRDLGDPLRVLRPPSAGAGVDSRPVVNLSLALNHAAGGLNPWGYRATNVAIHVLAGLALFGLARRTLQSAAMPAPLPGAATAIAFSAALLWTVHPLQTETVICVIQRTEAIVSLFYLLSLYCFARAVAAGANRLWFAAAWAACLLGMASKEVMVSAPLMLFLYDRTFVAGTFRDAWRLRGRRHLAFAATWLLLGWLVLDSGGARGGTAGFGQGVSPWTYLLTQARALAIYLKLSFWPHPLIVDYGAWLAPGLREVFGEALMIAGLLVATGWALARRPRLGFLGAFFFAVLAPSSSVYPLVSQTIAEHRMHLPLAAVLVLAVLAIFRITAPAPALGICLALAAAAGFGTIRRGQDYASELALWTDLVEKTPGNPWARFHLGRAHFAAGRYDEAERENRAALALMPSHADALFALGLILERRQRFDDAEAVYARLLAARPGHGEAHFRRGLARLRLGRPAEAVGDFAAAVHRWPDHADAEGNWGAALFQLGQAEAALPHFERVLALRPESFEARYNLALALAGLGRSADALPHLEAAARLAPGDEEVRSTLARLRSDLARPAVDGPR